LDAGYKAGRVRGDGLQDSEITAFKDSIFSRSSRGIFQGNRLFECATVVLLYIRLIGGIFDRITDNCYNTDKSWLIAGGIVIL
jgi:hypothetical protein